MKVKFPKLSYFEFMEVKRNLPETGVPIEMLKELKNLLKGPELAKNPTKNLQ